MPEILPFRGLRYSDEYTRPTVFAPPYDVISPADREHFTATDAYNITHIDVTPIPTPDDWYNTAAARLLAWRRQGVLTMDHAPAYYGYLQQFSLADGSQHSRKGVFAAVRLAEWGAGIYRHEHTRAAPRADRLSLMRATRTQLSPVFGMISDPELRLAALLVPPAAVPVDYVDQEGTRQVFWPIFDPDITAAIKQVLDDKEIVIADGHHRYETALAYRAERRAEDGDPTQPQPYDYVLMFLTSVQDPGLCILPTHRVIKTVDRQLPANLLSRLAERFEVLPAEGAASLEQQLMAFAGRANAFGLYLGGSARYICVWRKPEDASSGILESLDVSVLLREILEPLFNIDADALKAGDRVEYTISEAQACASVERGEAQAAFILNPTLLSQVWDTARALQTMPQKSTYFYPKLLTGLVIYSV